MATLKIENLDDGVVARLEAIAAQHQQTPGDEAARILSQALAVNLRRSAWIAQARRIAAMSLPVEGAPDTVELLREDRDR